MHHSDGLVAADGIFRALPDVPIVLFTLYKTHELEHAANLMGIRCVVGKEEGVPSLLSAIENELSRFGNAAQSRTLLRTSRQMWCRPPAECGISTQPKLSCQ